MARRRSNHFKAQVSHERWVISYADFVTLLFAFFVVLFATANADTNKARAVSEAVKAALSQGKPPSRPFDGVQQKPAQPKAAPKIQLSNLDSSKLLLEQQLREEIARGEVELHTEARGLSVSFKQAALFDSGQAQVKQSALPAMSKLASVLTHLPNQILLEGHTDTVPIHNEHFRNNWELSASRSIAILQVLGDRFQMPFQRMAISGYADAIPVASNDTEEGRARNRRVDVVIVAR